MNDKSPQTPSRNRPKAFLCCLLLLCITEIIVLANVNKLRSLSECVLVIKERLLNQQEKLSYDAIIMGDSRILGVNAKYIADHVSALTGKNFDIFNFAIPNHGIRTYYLFLQQYLENHEKPKYILFSSAPINISTEWTIKSSNSSLEFQHRLCHLYGLKELYRVYPLDVFLSLIHVKIERLSTLLLYRGRIKKAIAHPSLYFVDIMPDINGGVAEYNGGVGFRRTSELTLEEVEAEKYYQQPIYPQEESLYWHGKFFSLAKEQGIKVFIVNAPLFHGLLSQRDANGSTHRYMETIKTWVQDFDNVKLLGPVFKGYELSHFGDWQHLNRQGVHRFTEEITSYLTAYIQSTK